MDYNTYYLAPSTVRGCTASSLLRRERLSDGIWPSSLPVDT